MPDIEHGTPSSPHDRAAAHGKKHQHKHHGKKKKKKKKKKKHGADGEHPGGGHQRRMSVDHGGHATAADLRHAEAKAKRAAIVAAKRAARGGGVGGVGGSDGAEDVAAQSVVAALHHESPMLKQARAINLQRMGSAGWVKRNPAPGPRPTDLPPRAKPGLRYNKGGLFSVHESILRHDAEGVTAFLKGTQKGMEKQKKKKKQKQGEKEEEEKHSDDVGAAPQGTEKERANQRLGTYPHGTLLHLASQHGTVEILEALLSSGADLHAQDDLENTPLHRATLSGEVAQVKAMLRHSPTEVTRQLQARNMDGMTPIMLAIAGGHEKMRSVYINHMKMQKLTLIDEDRQAASRLATHNGEMRVVRAKQQAAREQQRAAAAAVAEAAAQEQAEAAAAAKAKTKKKTAHHGKSKGGKGHHGRRASGHHKK